MVPDVFGAAAWHEGVAIAADRRLGGAGRAPGGTDGRAFPRAPGDAGSAGTGSGGGLALAPGGSATIDDTTITGNNASTGDDDVSGTLSG